MRAAAMVPARSWVEPDLFDGPRRIGAWPWGALAPRAYGLIMIDPPWRFDLWSPQPDSPAGSRPGCGDHTATAEGKSRRAAGSAKSESLGAYQKSAQAQYRCMSLADIAALPVRDLAAPDCLLWLWATAPMLPQQLAVMAGWGFRYVTSGAWVKTTVNGKIGFGTGYVLRSAHEPFLIGAIGEPDTTRAVRSVVMAQAREHSRKPDAAYAAAEALVPGVRRADVFSRQRRAGWDAWGDEVGFFDARSDSAGAEPAGSRSYLQTAEGNGSPRPAAGTAVAAGKQGQIP